MNEEVLVRNTTKEAFEQAFRLVFLDVYSYGGVNKTEKVCKCNGYKIKHNELFLSNYSDKCEKFPYEYNIQQTIDFAWGWYENNKKPNGKEPDIDGSTRVAFEISTERCGVGSDDWGMFVSVKPIWFVYGK
jgi:hypothetical protein